MALEASSEECSSTESRNIGDESHAVDSKHNSSGNEREPQQVYVTNKEHELKACAKLPMSSSKPAKKLQ